jgi:glucokinase
MPAPEVSASLAIGVDIGGTKISAGVVDDSGAVIDRERRPTPGSDVAQTEAAIVDVVTALAARHSVTCVGIGAAGWIGADRATVLFSPHLAWRNEPLRDALAERIGLPLVVENDGNASAWAEYRFGAARGHTSLVCVTLGTGIGGGLVLDGSLYRGASGIACEYGHMTIVPDGRACACGNRGCWEMYASGRALARDARELAAESTCTTMGRWLGRGLANLAAALDPSMFVIGGGVSEAGELLLAPARQEFAHTLTGRGFRPVAAIEAAAFGADAGLVGAADLARGLC